MDHRRQRAVIRATGIGIDLQNAFFQLPETPHIDIIMNSAIRSLDGDLLWQAQHIPEIACPRAASNDHTLTGNTALVGFNRGDGIRPVHRIEALDLNARQNTHAKLFDLVGQCIHGLCLVGETAAFFMQNTGDILRLPVTENAAHIGCTGIGTLNENAVISDILLLRVDRADIVTH
ncbi:MAG: Uncharacterised protein [SAR116 cluster bacterium]|nr:MAG: Uncharacterised protein [SAR116 cluster bacterium]